MDLWLVLLLGIVCNLPVGMVAYKKQSLTVPGGIVTAGITGYLLFIIQPLYWVLLLVFFGSSTLLTKFKEQDNIKQEAMSLAEKGGERDSLQVLANAGIPILLAIIAAIAQFPVVNLLSWASISLVVAFAVVNADTWATELGVTSTTDPYWVLNPTKKVPRGTSGGVSARGLLASLLASLLIALIFAVGLLFVNQFNILVIIIITIGGLLGSFFDSLLGATLQVQYYCPSCEKMTEQVHHQRCDTSTTRARGIGWFSNDLVNAGAALMAIVVCILILNSLAFFG